MNRRLVTVIALAALTLLWSAAVTLNLSPYLRGPAEYPPEWRWWLAPKFDLVPVRLIPLALVVGAIALWWRRTRRLERVRLQQLIALSALGFALLIAVQNASAAGIPLLTRLISPEYSGYFPTALNIRDLRAFLLGYVRWVGHDQGRIGTHPPGNLVFLWFFYKVAQALPDRVSDTVGAFLRAHTVAEWAALYTDTQLTAAAVASVAIVAAAGVTVIPLYYLGLDTVGRVRAQYAVILYLLTPAVTLFAPVVDLTFTLLAVTALWAAFRGFICRSYLLLALSGVVLSVSLFMSFSNLPVAFTIVVAGIAIAWNSPPVERAAALKRLILQGLTAVAGGSLVWLLFLSNPITLFFTNTANLAPDRYARSYWAWLIYNPYDLFLFAGFPLGLLFVIALVRLVRRLRRRETLTPGELLFAAVLAGMTALFVSGNLRGEAARTLLYYFPIMALMSQVNGEEWRPREFAIIAGATLAQTIIFYLGLRVYH